jgi:hypothetical protein
LANLIAAIRKVSPLRSATESKLTNALIVKCLWLIPALPMLAAGFARRAAALPEVFGQPAIDR